MVQQIRNFFTIQRLLYGHGMRGGGGGGRGKFVLPITSARACLKAETRARHRREFHTEMTT